MPRRVIEDPAGIPYIAAVRVVPPGWADLLARVWAVLEVLQAPATRLELLHDGGMRIQAAGIAPGGEAERLLEEVEEASRWTCQADGGPGDLWPIHGTGMPAQQITLCRRCLIPFRAGSHSWQTIASALGLRNTGGWRPDPRGPWRPEHDEQDDRKDGLGPEPWQGS